MSPRHYWWVTRSKVSSDRVVSGTLGEDSFVNNFPGIKIVNSDFSWHTYKTKHEIKQNKPGAPLTEKWEDRHRDLHGHSLHGCTFRLTCRSSGSAVTWASRAQPIDSVLLFANCCCIIPLILQEYWLKGCQLLSLGSGEQELVRCKIFMLNELDTGHRSLLSAIVLTCAMSRDCFVCLRPLETLNSFHKALARVSLPVGQTKETPWKALHWAAWVFQRFVVLRLVPSFFLPNRV